MTKFDKKEYKEFSSRHSAHKWGLENYWEWIDRIQRELPQSEDTLVQPQT